MKTSIVGGHVIDPANAIDARLDIHIANDRVIAVGAAPDGFKPRKKIDAKDRYVCPGLIDLSVHLPEPGREHKGTIASELAAAVSGGVTTLCAQPDTLPILDNPAVAELIHQRCQHVNLARVLPLAALTRGLEAKTLTDMNAMTEIGCVAVSNANIDNSNAEILRRAMEYASSCDLTIHLFCENPELKNNGVVHEGSLSTRLGLPAIPPTAETVSVSRALLLAKQTGVRLHLSRISCGESVHMIQQARASGLPVTADTAITNLLLTVDSADNFNTSCHVDPPLREEADRQALLQGLREGVIDAICSDHQAHDLDSKRAPFSLTAPGASTIEHFVPLLFQLVKQKELSLTAALAAATVKPAEILNIQSGRLDVNAVADICIISRSDFDVLPMAMRSAGKNTPFTGWTLPAQVTHTLVGGNSVFSK